MDSDDVWAFEFTEYKIQTQKYSLDLDCFETKRNVDDVYLINIQYNIIIVDYTRG